MLTARQASAILLFRLVAFPFAVFIAVDAAGAAKPIDTDGPDFVESSEVVGKERFQFEAGVVSERDRRSASRGTTAGTPTLLRFGVADSVELRVESEGQMRVTNDNVADRAGSTVTGTGDTALGIKWHSQDRDRLANTPAVSWLLHFEAPTGSHPFKGHGSAVSLRSVTTWELPHALALGFMPGVAANKNTPNSSVLLELAGRF